MDKNLITIENCSFTFECPTDWNELIATDRDDVRRCEKCDLDVHYCQNDIELRLAVKQNKCVAIEKAAKDGNQTYWIGEISASYTPRSTELTWPDSKE